MSHAHANVIADRLDRAAQAARATHDLDRADRLALGVHLAEAVALAYTSREDVAWDAAVRHIEHLIQMHDSRVRDAALRDARNAIARLGST